MATNCRHSHLGQAHSGLSKRDRSSRPPILAEPAHNNRVKAPPQNSDPDLRDLGTCVLACPQQRIFPSLCLQSRSLEHWR